MTNLWCILLLSLSLCFAADVVSRVMDRLDALHKLVSSGYGELVFGLLKIRHDAWWLVLLVRIARRCSRRSLVVPSGGTLSLSH